MNTKEKKELTAADLALYIGCEVVVSGETETVMKLYGVSDSVSWLFVRVCRIDDESLSWPIEMFRVKPILRPLSDITDVEALAWAEFFGAHSGALDEGPMTFFSRHCSDYCSAESVRYLLSKHFDLFGWIESGLAIDKTKTK